MKTLKEEIANVSGDNNPNMSKPVLNIFDDESKKDIYVGLHPTEIEDMKKVYEDYTNFKTAQNRSKNDNTIYGYNKLSENLKAWKESIKLHSKKHGKSRFNLMLEKCANHYKTNK